MLDSKIYSSFFSAVNVVSSKPCVGPLPRIKISFYYKHAGMNSYQRQLLFTFLANLLHNVNLAHESKIIPESEYPYLLGSAFAVNLIAPNKEFPNVNCYVNDHKFIV